jgi:hypothetical protein
MAEVAKKKRTDITQVTEEERSIARHINTLVKEINAENKERDAVESLSMSCLRDAMTEVIHSAFCCFHISYFGSQQFLRLCF